MPGLDAGTLARLRAEAAGHASRFTDPSLIREVQRGALAGVSDSWLTAVIGRPVTGWLHLENHELYLAVAARAADAARLDAAAAGRREEHDAEQRARAERRAAEEQARREEWAALAAALPVPVAVCHNWTARHLDGYEQGGDHIVVLAGLHAGRLHRAARRPLCWTPSRAHELRHVFGNPGDEGRLPDCRACLRTARKITNLEGTPDER
jgi:hypothetical protein